MNNAILINNLDKSRGGVQKSALALCPEPSHPETLALLDAPSPLKQPPEQGFGRVLGGEKGSLPEDPTRYLESLAKGYQESENIDQEHNCGNKIIVGECDNGHQFLKVLYCGKEWCNNPVCVERTWKRRIARALPKIATMEKAGYFVFTVPEEMRESFKGQENLGELRRCLKRKLKRTYPDLKAITRYHWFGDKDLRKYHPHLNILVDALQNIPGEDLEELKRYYKELLERISGVNIGDKKIDLHYHYLKTMGRIIHAVKYIMRPTFLIYDTDLACRLKGFRNNVYWGKWKDQTPDQIEREAIKRESNTKIDPRVVLLSNKVCPVCGKPIVWYNKIYSSAYTVIAEEVGQGYYRVKDDNFSDWFRDCG